MASFELAGAVTEKEKNFTETWENVGQGINYIVRENRRGDEVYEMVSGSRHFKLTTYDRMLTEDKIVDHVHNPFRNGSFRPVIVPEDMTIESNPNAMSSEDIVRLFSASDEAWDAYLDVIDSAATYRRMMDLAEEDSGLTVRRLRQLEAKYESYTNTNRPGAQDRPPVLAQKDREEYESIAGSKNEPSVARRGRPPKSA